MMRHFLSDVATLSLLQNYTIKSQSKLSNTFNSLDLSLYAPIFTILRIMGFFFFFFYNNQFAHGMHNLFVINLKKDKYTTYQVSCPNSFYGFSRPIEFDQSSFYGLTFISFLTYVSNRIIMCHFLNGLTTFSLLKNYT